MVISPCIVLRSAYGYYSVGGGELLLPRQRKCRITRHLTGRATVVPTLGREYSGNAARIWVRRMVPENRACRQAGAGR
jgi:hypothetical protein